MSAGVLTCGLLDSAPAGSNDEGREVVPGLGGADLVDTADLVVFGDPKLIVFWMRKATTKVAMKEEARMR